MTLNPSGGSCISPNMINRSIAQRQKEKRKNNFACFLRRREIQEDDWNYFSRKVQIMDSFVDRIGLLKALEGHCGCVNCIEFNQEGNLLLSGSDDFSIFLWDVHRMKTLTSLNTGHRGNIFSVKFLPETGDSTIVSGGADCRVEVQQLPTGEVFQVCSCHTQRIKRIATIPAMPSLFLTASEDGTIMQFDTRSKHVCSSQPNNILINLKYHAGKNAECKCVAVNPMRSELVAVGASDPYIRIYDRRMIKLTSVQYPSGDSNRTMWERGSYAISQMDPSQDNLTPGCVQYYVPGHLPAKMKDYYKRYRSLTVTYLCYSTDGTHLLANLGGDHIYLFDTINAELLKQYDVPTKNGFQNTIPLKSKKGDRAKRVSKSQELNNGYSTIECSCNLSDNCFKNIHDFEDVHEMLPPEIEKLQKGASQAYRFQDYTRAIELYNCAIIDYKSSASLYIGRAAARMRRDWDCDVYAALKDCDRALHLDPSNIKARCRQFQCLHQLGRSVEAQLNFNKFQQQYIALKLHECSSWSDLKEWISTPITQENGKSTYEEEDSDDDGLIGLSQPETSMEKCWRGNAKDYEDVYIGHCNTTTDIKEAVFVGKDGQFIAAGSDDGNLFIWDRKTTNLVKVIDADSSIVNCVQSHPNMCMLATSGIESVVKLWGPLGMNEKNAGTSSKNIASITYENQRRMSTDPVEMMILQMGDFSHDLFNGPTGTGPRFSTEDDESGQNNLQCRPS